MDTAFRFTFSSLLLRIHFVIVDQFEMQMPALKIILLTLLNIPVYSTFGQQTACDTILWADSQPLTWNDFKGIADTGSKVAALSFISINYNLENLKNERRFTTLTYFSSCKSWFKANDSSLSLQHEQIHLIFINTFAGRL